MKHFISCAILLFTLGSLTSCGSFKNYVAYYDVGLKKVESPADAKKQFGETKVVNFKDGDLNKYRYEDDYIDIVWYVSSKQFNFELKNKSQHTIKLNWDDISYVNSDGCKKRSRLLQQKRPCCYSSDAAKLMFFP